MNTNKMREIDRLVSEMYDDGLEGDDIRHLEELLSDDSAAQNYYWSLVDTHIALCAAVSSNSGQSQDLRKRPLAEMPAYVSGSTPMMRAWPLAAAATVLMAGLVGLLNWTGGKSGVGLPRVASQPPLRSVIERMPRITKVSWEGPSFAANSSGSLFNTAAAAGAVTLHVIEGETADGYLFCLMPGESVKLMATFDATGENSLSVVEITGGEQATVKKVSFHNSGAGPKPLHANPVAQNRRYGVLGHWSESNTTEFPRYFLLTGVHKLARPNPEESWRLSKIAVLVEDESVVHIGWDDSGPAPPDGQVYQEDCDYDDLAASLFFDRPSEGAEPARDGLRVITNQQQSADVYPSALEGGHEFFLQPNATAIIKAASQARYLNAIVAIDADTQQVLWSSSKQLTQSTNLGAACVLNPTSTAKRIRLIGIHKPHDSKGPGIPWRVSSYNTLYKQPGLFMIGFEDSGRDNDFNDVRVSVLVTPAVEPSDR